MPKICIDIGHGSNTYPPSKGVGDFAEWSFNNAVGKITKDLAEVNGFEVFLTQPFDSPNVKLNRRIEQVNTSGCDIGFSIHANASNNKSVTGHEFWYWHSKEYARKLATIMDANAIALLPNKRRGLKVSQPRKHINFGILRATRMPFVLAEFGFFTNETEREELLKSPEFQKQCAKVIVKSACDYFGKQFIMFPKTTIKEPIKVPKWKAEPLQELHDTGYVNDVMGWLEKIDETAPNWLVFIMVNRLRKDIEKLKNGDA